MEKHGLEPEAAGGTQYHHRHQPPARAYNKRRFATALLALFYLYPVVLVVDFVSKIYRNRLHSYTKPAYGEFPLSEDPFHFLPCTNKTRPPAIDNPNPEKSWAELHDPNPGSWSWGASSVLATGHTFNNDPYAGRGIFLCGYLDVPIDYTNKSDTRISRQAVTKFQVSGLRRLDGNSPPSAGCKSARTLVVEPGGPSAGGQAMHGLGQCRDHLQAVE
ncbi:hypothetical protein LEL_00847 [Akanthomyces lecanii RCEF 1005]|uniref:Uncharacterized protein n=1 Tax=Akanthomyces lecanii RCEF 1005 TaxID=1081108 RepID=A0A162KEA0_CORDF|nr:hypothetical protein LEL_00847 [Akanthomyces lecanii RCEF 1005]